MKYLNQAKFYNRQYRDEASDKPEGVDNGQEVQKREETQEIEPAKLQEQLKALQQEKESLSNKVNELLGESKKAKEARRQAEQAAAEEARKKAEAEGNYQQLFESSEKERQALAEQLEEMRNMTASEKVNSTAMKLALSLEPLNDAAAEDLSGHIARRLKFVDNELKVVDANGNLTVSTPQDLVKEMQASGRYSFYLKGNQASGGGANGGRGGASQVKQITRSQFDGMSQKQRSEFAKTGGKVIND